MGYNGKHHILVKTTLATIWASFGENWATFMSTSGHTDCDAEYEIWSNAYLDTKLHFQYFVLSFLPLQKLFNQD